MILTAFEPFAGRPHNNSLRVAQEIQKILTRDWGMDISLCLLPVVYDKASKIALQYLAKKNPKPQRILSLGEGDCTIRFETTAYNFDNTPHLADNEGHLKIAEKIDLEGPESISFNLPAHKMYCSENDELKRREYFSVSQNPGRFVCNNTAYRLAHTLSSKYQYGFIHVPHCACGEKSDPQLIGALLAKAIGGMDSVDLKDCQNEKCHREFLERLKESHSIHY